MPESLCWHVLDGISQALLWLHHGHKHTFLFDQHMPHDDDWHPIIIGQISPGNSKAFKFNKSQQGSNGCIVYFTGTEDGETDGDVKLGCFQSASVCSTSNLVEALSPPWVEADGPYMAPVHPLKCNKET